MAEGPLDDAKRAKDAARLRDLEERLARKLRIDKGPRQMASHDQAHLAWRMVIELVAGLGLGFGIGYGLDWLFGTLYERAERKAKSPTVFNLGYTEEVAKVYPWVANLSGGVIQNSHPRQRAQAAANQDADRAA